MTEKEEEINVYCRERMTHLYNSERAVGLLELMLLTGVASGGVASGGVASGGVASGGMASVGVISDVVVSI